MKSRAVLVRIAMLSVLVALASGYAHPASPGSEFRELSQGRTGSLQVPRRAMSAVNLDLRPSEGSSGMATASRSDRASPQDGEEPAREPNSTFEMDLWTMLAGTLGLMIFVAMRRL